MEKISAAQKLRDYISQNQISINEISKQTGVSISKLAEISEADLNATEFLEICFYLNVDPRNFGE